MRCRLERWMEMDVTEVRTLRRAETSGAIRQTWCRRAAPSEGKRVPAIKVAFEPLSTTRAILAGGRNRATSAGKRKWAK